jgi:hypothetical protein
VVVALQQVAVCRRRGSSALQTGLHHGITACLFAVCCAVW